MCNVAILKFLPQVPLSLVFNRFQFAFSLSRNPVPRAVGCSLLFSVKEKHVHALRDWSWIVCLIVSEFGWPLFDRLKRKNHVVTRKNPFYPNQFVCQQFKIDVTTTQGFYMAARQIINLSIYVVGILLFSLSHLVVYNSTEIFCGRSHFLFVLSLPTTTLRECVKSSMADIIFLS